ncbi:UbiB-like protein kinase [Chloropicon primus]|uniref:UbiB-like protein kinase n=1 Tax=Chloropicon primus TaxID=1764295 RepID=A0A5B8MKY9_9CHLO|nr:UbiB-like protein kinase [Chloropicon primus]UPR00502.1 UbiB-like protein kinase [Chloropicon primus]|eukprot:QDZ21288.1 UbiB-like protein kinase [Chloropicon primus]
MEGRGGCHYGRGRTAAGGRARCRAVGSCHTSPSTTALLRRGRETSSSFSSSSSENLRSWVPRSLAKRTQENLFTESGACSVSVQYDPEELVRRNVKNPLDAAKLAVRGFDILFSLGKFFACLKLDDLYGNEAVKSRAAELRETLTYLGPSFIKAGQVLANRPDLIRADYMEELCVLQDDVPSFPDEEAFEIIERNLGRTIGETYSKISKEPVAAASLGQVYRATLKSTGEEVAVKVQRPGVLPTIEKDLVLFRWLAGFLEDYSQRNLGCDAQLIVDEFGEKILEELDYNQEARNIQDFFDNFKGDKFVKIPWVRRDLSGPELITMEWIDGTRCTDPEGIRRRVKVDEFIRVGVVSGLRQLLEFGLFHGDPHPGNIFALDDGRIAYVDFGNVAEISEKNKQVLIDAVVHAVNKDYVEMAGDFSRLGFLSEETDIGPIVPALEQIWTDSLGKSLSEFNFRNVTGKFNELVYQYPIRIPERFSLVIRTLLIQEGICITLEPEFRFLEVAYPYVAKRLLTDSGLRNRLTQVLFKDEEFQWERLSNLLELAQDGNLDLDLTDTIRGLLQVVARDRSLRSQLVAAATHDNSFQIEEILKLLQKFQGGPQLVDSRKLVEEVVTDLPALAAYFVQDLTSQIISPVPNPVYRKK